MDKDKNKMGGKMKIVYMITDECNTRCLHCYKKKGKSIKRSVSECKKDIKNLLKKEHQVITAGAEILCNPKILQVYQLVKQNYLLSNGIILANNPEIFEQLILYGINKVEISWHIGFQSVLNQIPEHVIRKAILNAQKKGLLVQINCVISNKNYTLIKNICQKSLSIGVRHLKLFQLLPTRREMLKFQLTETQKASVIKQAQESRQVHDRETLYLQLHPNFNSQITKKSIKAKKNGLFCLAGKDFAVVETDNRVYPCPFLSQDQFCIGTFHEGQLIINKKIKHDGKDCLAEKLLIKQKEA
ncbi:radical SAM protein [Patescibacteria group bacterium]|nr:radical SAM protein [Patescibacteria group bacterium]